MDEFPEDWEVKKLGDVADIHTGKKNGDEHNPQGRYPFFVRSQTIYRIDTYSYDGEAIIVPGEGGIGSIFHYINGKFDYHQRVYKISDFPDDMDVKYVYYYMRCFFGSYALKNTVKATVDSLRLPTFQSFPIHHPPLPEQRRIAAALGDMGKLIDNLSKRIEKKKAIKQGAMQELLTGKKRLPGFEGEWERVRLGSMADIRTGKRNGDEQKPNGLYPFFVRSQVVYRIDSYSYDGEAIVVPGEGGIGSIFHYINGKFDFHQRVYKISDFPEDISCKYVYYYMKQFFGKYAFQNTVKATVDSLRLPTFQNFNVDIPPTLAEQRAIAKVLGEMDAEIAKLEAKREKLVGIKKGMMSDLLTGKVRLKSANEV